MGGSGVGFIRRTKVSEAMFFVSNATMLHFPPKIQTYTWLVTLLSEVTLDLFFLVVIYLPLLTIISIIMATMENFFTPSSYCYYILATAESLVNKFRTSTRGLTNLQGRGRCRGGV